MRLAALDPLQHREQQRKTEQAQCKLGRTSAVEQGKPAGVDPCRKGLHTEIGDSAEIGDRLHDGQQNTCGNRRSGQRQAHLEEGRPGTATQGTCCQKRRGGLLQERGARQEVDVGIKHQHQHQGRAPKGPDFREPVVARPPARDVTQHRLHDSRVVKDMRVGIGQHIGGKGQRQHQRDLKHAGTGEAGHGHQPRGPHAQGKGSRGHHCDQQKGGARVPQQHRIDQVAHGIGAPDQRGQQNGHHRQGTGRRNRDRNPRQQTHSVPRSFHGGGACIDILCRHAIGFD